MSERLDEESETYAVGPKPRHVRRGHWALWLVGAIALSCSGLWILTPLDETKEQAKRGACISNVTVFGISLAMYATDHDGGFPEKNWMDATHDYRASDAPPVQPHTKEEDDQTLRFPEPKKPVDPTKQGLPEEHCPSLLPSQIRGYGYTMMSDLVGVKSAIEDAATHPMIFDSVAMERNSVGDLRLLPRPGRHEGWDSFVYADGHAKGVETP